MFCSCAALLLSLLRGSCCFCCDAVCVRVFLCECDLVCLGCCITYEAPFDRCDREEDYRIAWVEFEKRLGKA